MQQKNSGPQHDLVQERMELFPLRVELFVGSSTVLDFRKMLRRRPQPHAENSRFVLDAVPTVGVLHSWDERQGTTLYEAWDRKDVAVIAFHVVSPEEQSIVYYYCAIEIKTMPVNHLPSTRP